VSKIESPQDLHAAEPTKLTGAQWIVLAAAFLGWMFDGVEIGLFPLVVRPALQSLGMTDDAQIGQWNSVVVAAFLLGAAAGGIIFGWLGDKIGRVRSMVMSIVIYSGFTGACALATQPWHLGVFRFLASLGMGGEWSLAVALVMECWPERHRPRLAGAIGAAANFGFLFIAIVAMGKSVTPDAWRWIMLVGATPALLALVIIMFVPESERWKESMKKGPTKPLQEVFAPKLRKSTLLAIVFSGIPLIGTWAAVSGWTPLWVDQIRQTELARPHLNESQIAELDKAKTPDQRKAVLKGALTEADWKQVTKSAADAKASLQVVLAIGAIIGCFVAPVIGGIWGRRPVYFALCLASLLSCGYLYRCLDTYNSWFMLWAGIAGAVTAAFYGWLPLYLPELFPTRVRATGQGLSFNFGRILASVAALYMGQLVGALGGDYALAGANITLVYIAGMVLIWFAPETKGKPLPE
jgi:MFS family permease